VTSIVKSGLPRRLFFLCTASFCIAQPQSALKLSTLTDVGEPSAGPEIQFLSETVGWLHGPLSLCQTRNGGVTCPQVAFPMPRSEGQPATLDDVHFESPQVGWIEVQIESSGRVSHSVYRTQDGGSTWQAQPPLPITSGIIGQVFYLPGGQVGWVGGGQVAAANSGTRNAEACARWTENAFLEPVIFHTSDGGRHWTEQALPDPKCPVERLLFVTPLQGAAISGKNVYYTDDGGLQWRRSDLLAVEEEWLEASPGEAASISFLDTKIGWLSYSFGYIFKTADGGKSWREILAPQEWSKPAGHGDFSSVHFVTERRGWILGGDGAIYETRDAGTRWIKLSSGDFFHSLSCWQSNCWAFSDGKLYRIESNSP
jgi:photosystem II stability/assembly factor-like uncharacterized protein